jgi:hypothetical protein
MTKGVETDHAAAMLAVFEEIVAGSQGLVSDWALLTLRRRPSGGEGWRAWCNSIVRPSNSRDPGRSGSGLRSRPMVERH